MAVEERLQELGIALPEPAAAVANYVPFVRTGNLVSISGQLPLTPDGPITGKLGREHDVASGQSAARQCAVNLIAQVKAAAEGDLERVRRIVRLGGFVNSTEDFEQQPKVINGASDLMVEVFSDAGRHSRAAVGVNALPLGAAVELDGLVELA